MTGDIDTQRVIVCSCGHFHRHHIPCRQIYTVFNVESAAFQCDIREQNKFEAFYNKDETTINYTNKCNIQDSSFEAKRTSIAITTNNKE